MNALGCRLRKLKGAWNVKEKGSKSRASIPSSWMKMSGTAWPSSTPLEGYRPWTVKTAREALMLTKTKSSSRNRWSSSSTSSSISWRRSQMEISESPSKISRKPLCIGSCWRRSILIRTSVCTSPNSKHRRNTSSRIHSKTMKNGLPSWRECFQKGILLSF